MDAVRFGRALGFGARQAAKTLVTAVDAASAENPSGKSAKPLVRESGPAKLASQLPTPAKAVQTAGRGVAQARGKRQGLKRGTKRFGEAVWSPFVRLSGVLWLEVSGVFFGIFALCGLAAVWRLRGAWHAGGAERERLLGAMAMLGVFAYFCVSNFARARRRERGR